MTASGRSGTHGPPRLTESVLKLVLPRSEHTTVIGELREEYFESVLPRKGWFRAGLWFRAECLSLLWSYARVLMVREQSRELSAVMAARRLRKRNGRPDNGRERGTRIDSFIQDIRHGIRSLSRRPSFTVAAMLTLAIGIGVNAAVFSILYSVLIQPLPFRDPDRLVAVFRTNPEWGRMSRSGASYPDFSYWKDQNHVFGDMAAYHTGTVNLTGSGSPERLRAAEVSYNLMSVLGVDPELGRAFSRDEDVPGAPGTVIMSHTLWRRLFGSDPDVIGRTIYLNKEPHTVIGVAPQGFEFPDVVELWTPLRLSPTEGRDIYAFWVVARLSDGVSFQQAQADMVEIDSYLQEEFPESNENMFAGMMTFKKHLVGELGGGVIVFYVVVCLVLLLACANIANLMLALSTTRQTEIAIRSSLGAGRLRIARQLLTESVLLAMAGGSVGVILGLAGRNIILQHIPLEIPHYLRFTTNLPMILLLIGIIIMTGLLFGIAPALTAGRQDLAGTLQYGNPRTTGGASRTRLRSILIVMEVTVATFMLVGSGLAMKSYMNLTSRDPGIDPEQILTLRISLPETDYPDDQAQCAFFRDFTERIRHIPGVASASTVAPFPFGSSTWQRGYTVEGQEPPPDGRIQVAPFWVIEEDYFETMGIGVLQGRIFTAQDGVEGTLPVIVVTEDFARSHWPEEDPLGKRLKFGPHDSERPWREVIGVVGDIQKPDPYSESRGGFYILLPEFPENTMSVSIKASGDPLELVEAVRSELAMLDPDLPAYEINTMVDLIRHDFWPVAAASWLFTVLTSIAVILAAVGIYGIVAYSVTQRTREFGIRIALGARAVDVIRQVIFRMTRQAGLGMLLGLSIAFAGLRLASTILFEVRPTDPGVYLLTVLLMGGAALCASYIPARRATKTDPIEALREE